MVAGEDPWIDLDSDLEGRLRALHGEIRRWPGLERLDRIAVAVFDSREDVVRTFAQSNVGPPPLERLTGRLSEYPALQALARTGRPWVDNAMRGSESREMSELGQGLARRGFRSRYAVRVQRQGALYGFIFFNSRHPGFFTDGVVEALIPYRRLIDALVVSELTSLRAMLAAVNTARQVSHYRDEETGAHLDRVSHYSRVIALSMASRHGLTDEYVEYVRQYAPLHDLGKVAIPDSILLKPGRLNAEEMAVMRTHVTHGVSIVDAMVRDHGLSALPHVDILRNVVAYHHEAYDGSGYPYGLSGVAIPLEGRILAVADVFDALTSRRPYKEPWTIEAAAALLQEQRGTKFDPECVDVFLADLAAVAAIRHRFSDDG